ncbi:translation initiation factor IF-2-like [Ornithorhynchus anatinus]|uniref:translation initiation factor IF-2-like n=1 Tax=Ornithorhynchus anatinus TaxID=9258 RepID=UPI0010A7F209|nr:translation initiation factor IF-2-like [Ornithorhynchus anatinus]
MSKIGEGERRGAATSNRQHERIATSWRWRTPKAVRPCRPPVLLPPPSPPPKLLGNPHSSESVRPPPRPGGADPSWPDPRIENRPRGFGGRDEGGTGPRKARSAGRKAPCPAPTSRPAAKDAGLPRAGRPPPAWAAQCKAHRPPPYLQNRVRRSGEEDRPSDHVAASQHSIPDLSRIPARHPRVQHSTPEPSWTPAQPPRAQDRPPDPSRTPARASLRYLAGPSDGHPGGRAEDEAPKRPGAPGGSGLRGAAGSGTRWAPVSVLPDGGSSGKGFLPWPGRPGEGERRANRRAPIPSPLGAIHPAASGMRGLKRERTSTQNKPPPPVRKGGGEGRADKREEGIPGQGSRHDRPDRRTGRTNPPTRETRRGDLRDFPGLRRRARGLAGETVLKAKLNLSGNRPPGTKGAVSPERVTAGPKFRPHPATDGFRRRSLRPPGTFTGDAFLSRGQSPVPTGGKEMDPWETTPHP